MELHHLLKVIVEEAKLKVDMKLTYQGLQKIVEKAERLERLEKVIEATQSKKEM